MFRLKRILLWVRQRAEKLLSIVAVLLALMALWLSWTQLKMGNRLAWDYSGGEQCSNYRGEVFALWTSGVTDPERIRNWFGTEAGGALNDYGATSENLLAIDDFEANCGSVESLLDSLKDPLPQGSTPTVP